MGIPWFKVKKSYLAQGGKVFSSNFALYGDLSKRVMNILEGMVKKIEVYSIDEAFLDLQHIQMQITHMIWCLLSQYYKAMGLVFLFGLESRQQKLLPRLQVMLQKISMAAWESAV
jgi:DNA polymerase V